MNRTRNAFDFPTFAPLHQSALLWSMAGWGSEEYKSGPAHNSAWLPAFALLMGEQSGQALPSSNAAASTAGAAAPQPASPPRAAGSGGDVPATPRTVQRATNRARAVAMLSSVRDLWMQRAHLLGRAARHYERASQLLTSQCVFTAAVASPTPSPELALGSWITATVPARIDLAGGWSDTPPITFEAAPLRSRDSLVAVLPAGSSSEFSVSVYDASAPAGGVEDSRPLANLAARGGGLVVNVAVKVGPQRSCLRPSLPAPPPPPRPPPAL
jgi:hypothetical protein